MKKFRSISAGFILGFILLNQSLAIAQYDQQDMFLKNVIPPSPNAASLGKYADWPVNLYTGVPNIDIPIYELKGRSLSVPISLSYHASGIKVGENASCVGLGWSLQAGGVVTRSVRGLADDDQAAGYLAARSYYNNPGDLSSGTKSTYNNTAFCDSNLQLSVAYGNIDCQPDLFMINALGRSYKFYFSGNGTIVTQPYSNLRIVFNNSPSSSSWTVTLEDGTQLVFGGSTAYEETTNTWQSNTNADAFISSWYLKSVTSVTGEVINFTYYSSGGPVALDSYYSETDYSLYMVAANNLISGIPTTVKSAKNVAQNESINFLTLASIESDLCKVYFDTVSRSDLPGSVAVSGVRVVSKLQNKTIISYLLNYSYSTARSGNVYTAGYTAPLLRLKLNSLEEVPSDGGGHQFWQFAYNPSALPSRKSYAQDYWGYFNGATSNTNMKPFNLNFNPDTYAYGNRSPDSASMMAEMLTKITYPTGGYSQFTYEPASYPANEEQFQNVTQYPSLYLTYNQSHFTNDTVITFTTTQPQFFRLQMLGSFSSTYLQDFGPTAVLASAILKNSSGTTVLSISLKSGDNNNTVTLPSRILNPGTYTFTMSSISTQSDFTSSLQTVSLSANFAYLASLGIQAVNHKAGGVRIKQITYDDSVDNTKNIIKNYTYQGANVVSPIDPANDFVVLTTDNLYDCNPPDNLTACSLPGCLATSVIYNERSASTKFGLGSIQGGMVGYSTVTESLGANGQGGKNVYFYSNTSDANIPQSKGLPYPPIISYDYERGLLLEKDSYTAAGKLVAKQSNSYQYINRSALTAYKLAFKFNILSSCYPMPYLANVIIRVFYQDKADQVAKTSTTNVAYNTATGDSLMATSYYYYDDSLNMQPIRTVTFNSKSDSVVAYTRTALEEPSINSSISLSATAITAIDTMLNRNMVGVTLETEKYTKSILTDKALTNYKFENNGYVQPDNVMVQHAGNTLETRVYFPRYDTRGNLLEQLKSAGEKHDYIWDYQSTYPVAEVINGDSISIAYTSFEADGTGNWTVPAGGQDSTTLAITGRKSYVMGNGAISIGGLSASRTYTVSYWSTGGSRTVSGSGTAKQGKTEGSWTYYEHTVTGVTGITVSGTGGNIDELRLYPQGAQMTSYTYEPLVGISTQCDLNNRITYYLYDGMERLWLVEDQDRNILKEICYNYFGLPASCMYYYNVAESGTFTRNNCGTGGAGSSLTYTVPAGTYFSTLSQADANQKAINAVNANGQAYTNANATCTFWNVAESGTFTKNNCATGGAGSSVTYTVAANTYSSTVSQSDANQQAINAVNANGQNYANANGTCTFWNVATSGTYSRNNCTCLYTGSSVTYTVPAYTYSSTTSQAAANTLAQNDVNANGQNYANSHGTCTTTCSPPSQKIISCVCQTGTYTMVSQHYDGRNCVTQYGYLFSDGTYTVTSSTSTPGGCN
jgi:hypothetical protein